MICTDCVLHRGAVSNCIGGRGGGTVLLVGMAPGGEEDIAGECFVGLSGVLLAEMLTDAGYAPEDVRLTNAVRCFVPQDTSVSNESINACRRHLQEEIRTHRPEVIIALGDVALRSLCKVSGIAQKRGQPLPLHADFGYDCIVYPTYHPAFVARIPQVRPTVVADLRKVRDRTRAQAPIAYTCEDFDVLISAGPVAIDIETIDGSGEIVNEPTQIAYATDACTIVSQKIPKIGVLELVHHNGLVFDLPKLGMEPQGYDTMALAYLDDEAQPLGLEALCVRYLGVRGWKEDRTGAALGSKELQEYNARDALYTLRLYRTLRERLGERIRIYDEILLPAFLALRDCTQRGIFIDKSVVLDEETRLTEQIAALTAAMHAWPQAGDWFNPNSNAHLAVVFERVGITLSRRTARSGKPQIDKAVLAGIDHPYARTVEEYRERTKRLSTYVRPYAAIAAEGDGRVHNEYTLWRTATGRTSARRPNVQNLDREIKGFLSASTGHVYVHADYSAVEFWLAAWCAGEQGILEHERGWDPHTAFARLFYGVDHPTREQRQVAKSANFSQLYMGSAATLQEYTLKQGLRLDARECARLHGAWHALYPGFRPWYARTWAFVKEHGYIETATGRRRHFGDVKRLRGGHVLDAQRAAVNDLVQSLAADVALIGLSCCRKNGLPITGFFHDAVSFDFEKKEYSEATTNIIRRSLVDEPIAILREKFGVDLNVPLAVEITAKENA